MRPAFSRDPLLHTHDVGLRTDGDQAVDVFADGYKHLSSHVATLLGARGLVLNVNTSSTTLNEQLGQLHHSGKTTVTSISIGDDRAQVVDIGNILALSPGRGHTLLTLFPVVEQLSKEELVDLVGHSVLSSKLARALIYIGFLSMSLP